ncbi:MAG: flagellar basal body protein [Aestuariivirga sp.]|uniref:flagellar basal body protein n=1 Tax=Aestuariivirga sp. TaxID=2650926 RepID=UPI0038D0D0E1
MTWLAERQAVTASNIANADTPGYRARSVQSFSSYLEGPVLQLAATAPGHMSLPPGEARPVEITSGASWASSHSGNNVSIESELMTASSSSRMMNMDSAAVKSFHRMLMSSVKV